MAEPIVTLAQAKEWLRLDSDDEDAVINLLIADASELIETYIKHPVIADEDGVCTTIDDVPTSIKLCALGVIAYKFEHRDATSEEISARLLTNAGLDPYIDWSK